MKTIATFLLLTMTLASQAQAIDTRKHIEVTGSAEMSFQPDEVQLEIVLGENKKIATKKLEDIEKEFRAVLKKNNIDEKSIEFDRASNWYWWHYWKTRNSLNTMTVRVTLDGKTDVLKFVKDLNKDWVSNIAIAKTDHKDKERFRKEVKIQAMKAAKEKAQYLLESVGEKVGTVLSVEELPESNPWYYSQRNLMANAVMEQNSEGVDNVAEIKIRYEIKVKFEIQ